MQEKRDNGYVYIFQLYASIGANDIPFSLKLYSRAYLETQVLMVLMGSPVYQVFWVPRAWTANLVVPE